MSHTRPILLTAPHQLAGPRIILRRYADTDAPTLCATVRDAQPHLQRWLSGFEQPCGVVLLETD